MPIRYTPLVTGNFYHTYNRGVARQPTFFTKRDYERMMLTFRFYRLRKPPLKLSHYLELSIEERNAWITRHEQTLQKLVEIVCFVLLPNHFHMMLKQVNDGGITTFLRHVANSYTKYINTKQHRPGPLFQGEFKAVRVETNEQLLHVSRYIHLNPFTSSLVRKEDLQSYPWSSLPIYLGKSSMPYLSPDIILDQFSSKQPYESFISDHADYAKKLEQIQHLLIEKEELI